MNRRRFLFYVGILGILIQIPLNACKRALKRMNYEFNDKEYLSLLSILDHILPEGINSPGAMNSNAGYHIKNIIEDSSISDSKKRTIKNGIRWVEDSAGRHYSSSFNEITKEEKEKVLREIESFRKGKRFLSLSMAYTFEALLGDPVYGINENEKGWKWLGLIAGSPRPTAETKYLNS